MESNTKAVNPPQPGYETLEARIRTEALIFGFDLKKPLKTKDGDLVRIVSIDIRRHVWVSHPIVGEIIESDPLATRGYSTRLVRFNTCGIIDAKTEGAREKHSLAKNNFRYPDPLSTTKAPAEPEAIHLGTIAHVLMADAGNGIWAALANALNRGDVPGLGKNYEQALRDSSAAQQKPAASQWPGTPMETVKPSVDVPHSVIPREVKADIVKEFKNGQDLVLVIRGDTPDKWCVTGWK